MIVYAIAHNYHAHNQEMSRPDTPAQPIIFMKGDSVLKNGKPFFLPDFSHNVQYETEIVVKICRQGKYIDQKFAHRYYDQFTVGIDFTARDLQTNLRNNGQPWEISKAFENSATIGAFLPLSTNDVQQIDFQLQINGGTVQHGNTQHMIFTVDEIICYLSRFFMLRMGDLIFTGTPAGVGNVKIGDHLQGFANEQLLLDFYVR
jgi:2-keto-4-pentenoate hydratase/2-oxohepta-3-ene-1,7-dioic acid hydratase in catechol pathway